VHPVRAEIGGLTCWTFDSSSMIALGLFGCNGYGHGFAVIYGDPTVHVW